MRTAFIAVIVAFTMILPGAAAQPPGMAAFKAGMAAMEASDPAAAIPHFEAMLAAEEGPGGSPAGRAQALQFLGTALALSGEFAPAEARFIAAADAFAALEGPGNALEATMRLRAGQMALQTGRLDDAIGAIGAALDALIEDPPGTDPMVVAEGFQVLAAAYATRGVSFERARDLAETALRLFRSLDTPPPALVSVLIDTGAARANMGDRAGAEALFHEALALADTTGLRGSPRIVGALTGLAGLLHETGRIAEAGPLIQRAIDITEATSGLESMLTAQVYEFAAGHQILTGNTDQAVRFANRAAQINEARFGEGALPHANALGFVAAAEARTGRYADAARTMRRALYYMVMLGLDDTRLAQPRLTLAQMEHAAFAPAWAERARAETIALARIAAQGFLAGYGAEDRRSVEALGFLSILLAETPDGAPEALTLARQAAEGAAAGIVSQSKTISRETGTGPKRTDFVFVQLVEQSWRASRR